MTDIKKCFVALEGVPESERIIFKLICSVSARTRGRDLQYVLLTVDESGKADILIEGLEEGCTASSNRMPAYRIGLPGHVEENSDRVNRDLSKPLIATRVLTALDEFVNESAVGTGKEKTESPGVVSDVDGLSNHNESENLDIVDTLNFEITEQEASELAIVHDESLTNPANMDVECVKEYVTAEITPIRIKETNKPVLSGDNYASELESNRLNTGRLTPRALVVDDSPSVRKQLELELELFDVNVDYAATANEAMSKLNAEDYDVAFLDVVLPDKDGFSICRHIKETTRNTSVIMLTGKAKQADKVKGALAGCDAYMVKPVGRLTFQATVRNYLSLIDASAAIEM